MVLTKYFSIQSNKCACYATIFLWTAIAIALYILEYTYPKLVVFNYALPNEQYAFITTMTFATCFSFLNVVLLVGLLQDTPIPVLFWVCGHMILFVVHAIHFIITALTFSLRHKESKLVSIGRNGTIMFGQLIWLITICHVTKYWMYLQDKTSDDNNPVHRPTMIHLGFFERFIGRRKNNVGNVRITTNEIPITEMGYTKKLIL